jgi:hypothetical protein
MEWIVGQISVVAYETSTNCCAHPLAVVYCNAYCSDESDAEKLEISTKTDVYSYRRVHICTSYSAGHSVVVVGH